MSNVNLGSVRGLPEKKSALEKDGSSAQNAKTWGLESPSCRYPQCRMHCKDDYADQDDKAISVFEDKTRIFFENGR